MPVFVHHSIFQKECSESFMIKLFHENKQYFLSYVAIGASFLA